MGFLGCMLLSKTGPTLSISNKRISVTNLEYRKVLMGQKDVFSIVFIAEHRSFVLYQPVELEFQGNQSQEFR